MAAATEVALAAAILAGAISAGAISAGTWAVLLVPWPATPCSVAIILFAIDLVSGTAADLPSGTATTFAFAITGSLEIGLPFLAWVSRTDTTMTATRAYGRRGDGAGGTSATNSGAGKRQ